MLLIVDQKKKIKIFRNKIKKIDYLFQRKKFFNNLIFKYIYIFLKSFDKN